jgi:CRISPR type III-A-associated protein Csm2
MSEELQTETPQPEPEAPVTEAVSAPAPEAPVTEAAAPAPEAEAAAPAAAEAAPETPAETQAAAAPAPAPRGDRPPREPRSDRPPREPRGDRPPRDRDKPAQQQQGQPSANRGNDRRGDRPGNDRPGNDRPRDGGQRGGGGGDRRPDMRRPEGPIEIEYDKLISDSLYLDNQAHVLVARLRDLDAGTRSQLRRLYGAVRRACRAPEADRQHQFVMLRARLAYTSARHGLRSLDPLEKLLLQVTRRNETRGYDRFRDLFEAIIAYNE